MIVFIDEEEKNFKLKKNYREGFAVYGSEKWGINTKG